MFDKAVADYIEALRLKPNCPDCLNALAWLLATCPEDKCRDGKKAVEFATKGCELADWNGPALLDTLAAASAESGDFATALKWQTRAIELVSDPEFKKECESRLALYRDKKPYREKP